MTLTNTGHTMLQRIKELERVAKHTATPPPASYNYNTALVEKQAIITTKVAELETLSLLKIMWTAAPPPPAPAALPPPPAKG